MHNYYKASQSLVNENLAHLATSFALLVDSAQTGVLRWKDISKHEESLLENLRMLRNYIFNLSRVDKLEAVYDNKV